jgi:type VI secretion system secreted protein VgrG
MRATMPSHANAPLQLITPLGRDVLCLAGFTGREGLSQLFSFDLDLLAENRRQVPFEKLLGQSVTIRLALGGGKYRAFNGIVRRLSQGERDATFTHFRAEIVPQLWMLTRRVQSRIFQHVNVPDILRQVFGSVSVRYELTGTYHPRNYCVQYHESDFAFASRLMEEEGIYYFFTHEDDSHQLVVADSPQSHPDVPDQATFLYDEIEGGTRPDFRVYRWEKTQELRSGKVTLWDHHFELPHKHLEAGRPLVSKVAVGKVTHPLDVAGNQQLEIFEFPAGYARRFDGIDRGGGERPADLQKIYEDNQRTARIRAQQEEVRALTIRGAGNCRQFVSGHRFNLARHFDADGPYVLTTVDHDVSLGGNYRSGDGVVLTYQNRFTCIPAGLPFRPARTTPRPRIEGTQTAVVTGPPGPEQIYTDRYGRVKVRFHWDRAGGKPEDSSCWIRVGTPWAGHGWGMIHIPRRGQEVIVAFEEGDPDRPIIVGSVYNAEMMPPFPLPECKKQSGMVSASNQTTGGYNQISINDGHGKEQISIHAQNDMTTKVENEESHAVGQNYKVEVGGSHSIKVAWVYSVEARDILMKASDQITLRCGGSTITLTPNDISISSDGPVSINGQPIYLNC